MIHDRLDIVFLGLSITSSWGNGHATTYRGLIRELHARGHRVTFLERDLPWYADHRDLVSDAGCDIHLYHSLDQLRAEHGELVRQADAVIVGSYVPAGVAVGQWITDSATGVRAFYDIDTPVTIAKLNRGDFEYLTPALISRYDLYLSFSGGGILRQLEHEFDSPMARPLYCSVDPDAYYPEEVAPDFDLGYMGTYSPDRQPLLESLLADAARLWPRGRFIVAGPQYPTDTRWPENVVRQEHLPPSQHRAFYCSQRFTLNITRADMIRAGYSPSVRLFEAAACGVPIISDCWDGLGSFFDIGTEILVSSSPRETLKFLQDMPQSLRCQIGARARRKVLAHHTSAHRAHELEQYLRDARVKSSSMPRALRR